MKVLPDLYLDNRNAAWLLHEKAGLIRYDVKSKLVWIDDALPSICETLVEIARAMNVMALAEAANKLKSKPAPMVKYR